MAEGKTYQELKLDKQLKQFLVEEQAMKMAAKKIQEGEMKFSLQKDDLVRGIILREILGPPKASEG